VCRPRLTPSVQRRLSGPCAVKNTHKTLIFLTFIKHTTVRIEGEKDTKKISSIGVHVASQNNFLHHRDALATQPASLPAALAECKPHTPPIFRQQGVREREYATASAPSSSVVVVMSFTSHMCVPRV